MSRPIDFRATAGTPSGQGSMAPTDDDVALRLAAWLADVSAEAGFASTPAEAARRAGAAPLAAVKLASVGPVRP